MIHLRHYFLPVLFLAALSAEAHSSGKLPSPRRAVKRWSAGAKARNAARTQAQNLMKNGIPQRADWLLRGPIAKGSFAAGEHYMRHTAVRKADYWRHRLLGPAAENQSLNPIGSAQTLFIPTKLAKTFDPANASHDEMPRGRDKAIHLNGAVAEFRYESTRSDHPFTGVLREGGMGFMRGGFAGPAGKKESTFGMGIKFLIDGMPSLNIMAMNTVVDQPHAASNNYITRPAYSTFPVPKIRRLKDATRLPLLAAFQLVAKDATVLPIEHLMTMGTSGRLANTSGIPKLREGHNYRLRVDYTGNVQRWMQDYTGNRAEARQFLATVPSNSQFARISVEEIDANFNVVESWDNIGRVKLVGKFTNSEATKDMFFLHSKKLRSAWEFLRTLGL